jgi:hypothetical protein
LLLARKIILCQGFCKVADTHDRITEALSRRLTTLGFAQCRQWDQRLSDSILPRVNELCKGPDTLQQLSLWQIAIHEWGTNPTGVLRDTRIWPV